LADELNGTIGGKSAHEAGIAHMAFSPLGTIVIKEVSLVPSCSSRPCGDMPSSASA
jgi:hypothetical protein